MQAVNAALHLGWAARHRRYNPGAVTAALLVLPWAVAGLRGRLGPGGASRAQQLIGLGAGLGAAVGQVTSLRRRAHAGR